MDIDDDDDDSGRFVWARQSARHLCVCADPKIDGRWWWLWCPTQFACDGRAGGCTWWCRAWQYCLKLMRVLGKLDIWIFFQGRCVLFLLIKLKRLHSIDLRLKEGQWDRADATQSYTVPALAFLCLPVCSVMSSVQDWHQISSSLHPSSSTWSFFSPLGAVHILRQPPEGGRG